MNSIIEFTHGANTCVIEPGKPCRFQGAKGFGTRPVCMLFGDEPLLDKNGWLQRCEKCIKTFGEKE